MRIHTESCEEFIEQNLIENYSRYYRLAYSYVKNESDAMDIVQEAAYKAIYKSSTLKKPEYAGTWICRIVMNEAYNVLRKKQKENDRLQETVSSGEDTYVDLDLQQAIRQLKEEEQTVIYLRYYEDKPLDEIAQITQEKLSTVKSRLYRAMDKLKVALAEY
ncbi:MAG: sigma-70 family RNA polymerase sigma factor [Eubacterium sp.]|nr:sigma-70 family RNA polymerase sigma factor [Eubacterium sp.]